MAAFFGCRRRRRRRRAMRSCFRVPVQRTFHVHVTGLQCHQPPSLLYYLHHGLGAGQQASPRRSVVYQRCLSVYLPSIIPVSFPPVRPVHCYCYDQHPGWRPPRKADRRPWPGSIRGTSACVCLSFPAIRANARGRRPAWTPTAMHNPVLKPPLECFRLRSAEGPERICGEGLGALPVDCRFSSPTWLPHTSARGLLLPLHPIFLQGRKLPLSAAPPVRESCTETRGRARSHTAVGVAPAVCSSSLRSDLEKQGPRSSVVAPCATHPMHCMRTGPRWAPPCVLVTA